MTENFPENWSWEEAFICSDQINHRLLNRGRKNLYCFIFYRIFIYLPFSAHNSISFTSVKILSMDSKHSFSVFHREHYRRLELENVTKRSLGLKQNFFTPLWCNLVLGQFGVRFLGLPALDQIKTEEHSRASDIFFIFYVYRIYLFIYRFLHKIPFLSLP